MKKNFKFMLTAMLAVFGLSNASAQELKKGSTVNDAYYTYTLTSDPVETTADNYTANVELTKVRDGKNPVVSGAIYMPEHGVFTTAYGEENYTLTLTTISDANKPLRNLDLATTVTIPATVKAIPEFCFQGCSAMTSITFEANSQVESIGSWAFATTKITNFNFNNCVKLAELPDEVFVEPGLNNTYITEVTVPKSPLFKHINGAFQNLNKLTKINQLGESWIQEVIAEAFTGTELKELDLPGNALKYVDGEALKGLAKLEKLSIGVNKLLYLGGGHVNADYTFAAGGYLTNLFGLATNNTLKELNLTGELMGKIAENAFLGCTALAGNAGNTEAGLLDLTGMTLGSTGQIQANAFNGCTALKAVKVGNIANNETLGYTIEEYAFKDCANLATVTIGDITTSQAIGLQAFGTAPATVTIGKITAMWAIANNAFPAVEKVTIGSVISNGPVFDGTPFVWKDTNGTFLKLATGTGEYLSQSSANSGAPAIPTLSFDFSAVGTLSTTTVMPEITIGKIYSKGGAFAMSAIRNATAPFKSVTFAGEIAANGIDAPIFELDNAVTALTFKGAIGEAGIAKRVFANQTKLATLTFEGLLAEGAVAAYAFYNDASSLESCVEQVFYTFNGIPDYTVNPFDIHAFDSDGGADVTTTRTIKFSVTDPNLLANYQDEFVGLETDGKFDIYLVYFYEEPEVIPTTFRVYQNGDTKYAWGRYDLGKFNIEKGPYADKDKSKWYVATDMIIPRYVNVDGVDIKLTLYGSYTDENPNAVVPGKTDKGESLVYMVPLQVYNGQYQIKKTNSKTIIVKAEAINGTFANKDIEIPYDNSTALTENSVWTTLPAWDTERGWHKNTTGDVVTTQILWDRTNPADYDVWGAAPNHSLDYAPKAIYSLSNPAKYQGVDVVKVLVSKDSGKIGQNWYYTFLRHFGDTGSAARIIWMDEAEATAIFGVKENAKAAEKSGEMYNLQGIRISAPQKGQIYIIDGKKYIGK